MDKIYTRKRLFPDNKKDIIKVIKFSAIILIALTIVLTVSRAVGPIIDRECLNLARNMATRITNEQTTVVMEQYKYEDLVSVYKDDNNNIKMIKLNINPLNSIISDVPLNIQNKIDSIEDSSFGIRLGSFMGLKIFAGRGPKVRVVMSTIGSVETNLVTEFKSVGVNQTLHRIFLDVKCSITVLTPYSTITEKIVNQVLLAEAVIVGDVPEGYYNIEELKAENLLDVVE